MPASPWECWSPVHGISKWPPLLPWCTVQYLMRAAISKLKYHPNWHICLQICYQQGLVAPLTLSLAVIRIFWKTTLNIPELWIWQHSPPSIKSSNLLKVRWRQSEAVRRRDKLEILTPPPVTPLAGAVLFLCNIYSQFWRFQFLATRPTLISILNQGLSLKSSKGLLICIASKGQKRHWHLPLWLPSLLIILGPGESCLHRLSQTLEKIKY